MTKSCLLTQGTNKQTTLKNKVKYQHQRERRGFVITGKNFKVNMICYKVPCSYFKSPWLFLEWEVGPTYLQISLLKARPLPDPIDMGSTILDESSGFKLAGCSKLYIPSTINIWKKVLSKVIWVEKNWLVFWQIELYIM